MEFLESIGGGGGGINISKDLLLHVCVLHECIGRGARPLSAATAQRQSRHGWDRGRAGGSLRDGPASPREITLFWASRGDIMTDGT